MIHYSQTEVKRCLIMHERNASYISHVLFKSQVDAVLRDVVRKRRSFKMTQNTFDKIWRRLPVALEY